MVQSEFARRPFENSRLCFLHISTVKTCCGHEKAFVGYNKHFNINRRCCSNNVLIPNKIVQLFHLVLVSLARWQKYWLPDTAVTNFQCFVSDVKPRLTGRFPRTDFIKRWTCPCWNKKLCSFHYVYVTLEVGIFAFWFLLIKLTDVNQFVLNLMLQPWILSV